MDDLYSRHALGARLEAMRSEWKARYDFILIDSRTGVTDTGGICTIQMPDRLDLLATTSRQSIDGIVDVARRAFEATREHVRERLLAALAESGGNVAGAATGLGLTRSRMYRLLKSLGISPARAADEPSGNLSEPPAPDLAGQGSRRR